LVTGTGLDYWARHISPARVPFMPNESMRQGSLVDCLLTDYDNYDSRYFILPSDAPKKPTAAQRNAKQPSLATVEAIAFWDRKLPEMVGDREIITTEWRENAHRIAEMLTTNPLTRDLVRYPSQEPHFWHDSELDIDCRYKPDFEGEDLIDLKQARSAKPQRFQSNAYFDYAYDVQIAHYRKGFRSKCNRYPTRSILLAYEWNFPHNFSINIISEEDIREGERRREEAIILLQQYLESDYWPSYGEVVTDMAKYAKITDAANSTDLDDLELEGL
jgi:hypothetical protein